MAVVVSVGARCSVTAIIGHFHFSSIGGKSKQRFLMVESFVKAYRLKFYIQLGARLSHYLIK